MYVSSTFSSFWDEDDNNNDGKYRAISNDEAGPGLVDRKQQAIELFRYAVWSFRGGLLL